MHFKGRKIKVGDKVAVGRRNTVTGIVIGDDGDDHLLLEVPATVGWRGADGEPKFIKKYALDPKKHYWWVDERQLSGHTPVYCSCIECKQHNEWAQPNRRDGSFLCWSCSRDYAWKYPREEAA